MITISKTMSKPGNSIFIYIATIILFLKFGIHKNLAKGYSIGSDGLYIMFGNGRLLVNYKWEYIDRAQRLHVESIRHANMYRQMFNVQSLPAYVHEHRLATNHTGYAACRTLQNILYKHRLMLTTTYTVYVAKLDKIKTSRNNY